MAGPSSLETLSPLHHKFSRRAPACSSLTSMKLKSLLQTFIFSHMYRIARALAKAKSVLFQLIKNSNFVHFLEIPSRKSKNKLLFSSFRLHYNWCSSHVMPVSRVYYDTNWSTMINATPCDVQDSSELSGYLQWLEEKGNEELSSNEIDRLADMFIANCHEKFRLEKQESYRRFQEMIASSA